MIEKINLFWLENKYNLIAMVLWCIFYPILHRYGCTIMTVAYWILLLITILFRYIGYLEGKRKLAEAIIGHEDNLHLDVSTDDYEPVVCDLKDITPGTYFSLAKDMNHTKYIKCNSENTNNIECLNLNTNAIAILNEYMECIVYQTKVIFVPLYKTIKKED